MRTALPLLVSVALAGCGGRPSAAPAPAPVRTIAMDSEVTGTLTRGDPRLRDSSSYEAWEFQGTAGQIVQIDVTSMQFDAYAYLRDPRDSTIARDDDSGGGTNARIIVTLPVTGTYRILANSIQAGRYGPYAVRLRDLGRATAGGTTDVVLPGTVGQIVKGQTVTGRLTLTDRRLSDGSLFQAWTYMGRAGDTVTVHVNSSDFDAYAIIQDGNGVKLAADDDSGGGTNARIVFTLPYTGAYRIVANTYKRGATGAYTMSVE